MEQKYSAINVEIKLLRALSFAGSAAQNCVLALWNRNRLALWDSNRLALWDRNRLALWDSNGLALWDRNRLALLGSNRLALRGNSLLAIRGRRPSHLPDTLRTKPLLFHQAQLSRGRHMPNRNKRRMRLCQRQHNNPGL